MPTRLRVKGLNGTSKTITCDDVETLSDFLLRMSHVFESPPVELLSGYPPQLCSAPGTQLIADILKSGDSVSLRTATPLPTPPPVGPIPGSTPATASPPGPLSSWACGACTFLNTGPRSACEMCQIPRSTGPGTAAGAVFGYRSGASGGVGSAARHRIPDDNSCLFHAIIFLLSRSESPQTLRNLIASTVRNDPVQWSAAMLGRTRDDYICFITDPSKWGGQVELSILSSVTRVEIAAVDIQSGRMDVYGQGSGYSQRVYMLFSGIHFDAVTFGASTRVVPAGDAGAESSVSALAASLRAAGAYTDQQTMQLVCQTCGWEMSGDYEARLHAGSSGHTDFKMKTSY